MTALARIATSIRRPRRAALALAAGAAAAAVPLMGAASAHADTTPDVAPVSAIHITDQYGIPGPWAAGHHTGVDFAVPTGTQLHAVAAGTVTTSGWGGAYGNEVVVKLTDGKYALYAHLSQRSVSVGQHVAAGQQIGLSGATGNATGPHLHFEIDKTPKYGSDIDPIAYLRAHGAAV